MNYKVINTWNENKVVYKGTYDQCVHYLRGNNSYQCNYSKLRIEKE